MSEIPACTEPRRGDLLAAYEMGLLQDHERLAFEQHLDACPQCLEELYALAPAAALLREDPARFAAAAEKALRTARNTEGRRGFAAVNRRLLLSLVRPRILAPAAVMAVLVVLVVTPTLQRGSRLADLAVVEPLAYTRVPLRSGADQAVLLFYDGMGHYVAGRYFEAGETLAAATLELDRRSPEAGALPVGLRDQAHLYLGVSLLLEGRPSAAAGPLTVAAASNLPPVADRGRWYLAQAYLLDGQKDGARTNLELLKTSRGYGPQARKQLEALDRRR